ncbi:MAG: ATP-binding cassette domain-containing protein [Deltaproteobacteria bacterium]|nr:ATP-binding cassette domain-containing protein [Deltaproteobacteria bacterium]
MPLLEIKNLSFQVDGAKIMDDLCLSVEAAEVHALLGTNGTGKSTLAYLIVGCEGCRPTAGTILFDGQAIHTSKIHERAQLGITMAWQEPVRFEGISVAQYLTLKDRDLDPAPFLEMVGLEPGRYLTRMVDRSLSGGERKRIELASILALRPRLAIFDEPDSGIDMLSIRNIMPGSTSQF